MNSTSPVPKSIVIIGRRHRQRSTGNTYHTVEVIVDGKGIGKTNRSYGGESNYEDSALALLRGMGYIPKATIQMLWQYCQENGILFYRTVADVKNEKDL